MPELWHPVATHHPLESPVISTKLPKMSTTGSSFYKPFSANERLTNLTKRLEDAKSRPSSAERLEALSSLLEDMDNLTIDEMGTKARDTTLGWETEHAKLAEEKQGCVAVYEQMVDDWYANEFSKGGIFKQADLDRYKADRDGRTVVRP